MKSAKRIDIVRVKMVKEASFTYAGRRIKCPEDAANILREFIGDADREYFVVLCVNTKNEPTNISVVHIGSVNASVVHPREILKTAILSNATSIFIGHQHPSGDPRPSPEDLEFTKNFNRACEIMDIPLLDHIILGENTFTSLKEKGYI